MLQIGETFFTSVGCMDGRSECAVAKWGREKFNVKFADAITEAGLAGLLAKDNVDKYLLESLKKKVLISIEKHHSKNIVVSGHEDCAGNPVEDNEHKKDVLKAVKVIQSFVSEGTKIIPVFVKRSSSASSKWIVEEM